MVGTYAGFQRFVNFFGELFGQPNLLADAECRQSYKDYVPAYYRDVFGAGSSAESLRHLKWYRRLSPLFELPAGSKIMDYGGGYGMDSIFLASLGYQVVFYEISPHHIGVAKWFAKRFGHRFGPLPIEFVLAGKDPPPSVDAILANEVAHHIEPAQRFFDEASALLKSGQHLYLLEPNFMSPLTQAFFLRARGLQTTKWLVDESTGQKYLWGNEHIRPIASWHRLAARSGFLPQAIHYVAPWFHGEKSDQSLAQEHGTERLPLLRSALASHVTIHYLKS